MTYRRRHCFPPRRYQTQSPQRPLLRRRSRHCPQGPQNGQRRHRRADRFLCVLAAFGASGACGVLAFTNDSVTLVSVGGSPANFRPRQHPSPSQQANHLQLTSTCPVRQWFIAAEPSQFSREWGAHASRVLPTASRRWPRLPTEHSPVSGSVRQRKVRGATLQTTRRRHVLPISNCMDMAGKC